MTYMSHIVLLFLCTVDDENGTPENGSLAVDTFPSLNPLTVQLMRRLKLFDATYIQCSEDFTTVSAVGEKEAATRGGDAFIIKYQELVLGRKVITETVSTNKLAEDQYVLLLSEIEDQHPMVLCQPQYAQQSMVLSALEQSKLVKAKQHIASFFPVKQQPAVPPRPLHTTPQPTFSREMTLPLPNEGMLTVKKGDLLKEKVTAIVNAANERLDHIGGVAFAIDRASGGNVQRESREVIQKCGLVPTGQVAITGAGGRLQCQRVIHAVGPNANERPHKECEQLLKLVCENVLGVAEAQGMVSVALPAISSGIFGMKKDVVAQILISTILHYPYQHSSSLKDIRIVLFEEETLGPFLQFASVVKKGIIPSGTAQRVIPVPQAPDVVEIPLEKTHRKMVVKKAHFIYEDADIKVAAICSELGFQTGSNKELDGHLKGRLSEAVRGRYQYRRPDKFDVFTVHLQHATFGCRYLVIVNLFDRSLGTRHDAHKYLQQILQAVCQEADTLEMPSIVIAPSTFSVGDFQNQSILPAFIRMINHFKFTNDDFFTDVRFLALDQNGFNVLVAGAERYIGKSLRTPVQSPHSTGSHLHGTGRAPGTCERSMQEHGNASHVQTSTPHQFSKGAHQTGQGDGPSATGAADTHPMPSVSIPFHQGRYLTIKKGNLVEETAVAIVNSTDKHLQPPALPVLGHSVNQSTASQMATSVPADDVVEIPLEKTHRKMVVKKAHFIYEDADIKVAAICSELGFQTGSNKELDGHLKGQLSEAVRGRYQYRRPDKFDVFTVHVQHATFGCRYLVIINILDRSLGTRHDAGKYLQQILQAVCQEADTLEMPSVVIAPNTFTVGGFQKGSILPEFIRVISHFRFTNDDCLTEVRFLANQDAFNSLVADAERTVGRVLRRISHSGKVTSQAPLDSAHPSSSIFLQPPAVVVRGISDNPPASEVGSSNGKTSRRIPEPAKVAGQAPLDFSHPTLSLHPQPPASVVGGGLDNQQASGIGTSKGTKLPSPGSEMIKLSEHAYFAVACGDLCKVQADAVVVPVAPSLDLKSGVVQAVDTASGGAISRAVKQIQQTKQRVFDGTAIPLEITKGLNCKHIILLIRNAKGNAEALDHACRKALNVAEGLSAHSVTFPPISSNKGKDKLAKCMTGAFASFRPQNPQYIVSVTVVVRENDEVTLKAFRSIVGEDADHGRDELPQVPFSDVLYL